MTDYDAALAALDELAETERTERNGLDDDDARWAYALLAGIATGPETRERAQRALVKAIDRIEERAVLRNIAAPLIALARAVVEERHLGQNLRAPMDFDAKDDALIARLDATDALIAALTKGEGE